MFKIEATALYITQENGDHLFFIYDACELVWVMRVNTENLECDFPLHRGNEYRATFTQVSFSSKDRVYVNYRASAELAE